MESLLSDRGRGASSSVIRDLLRLTDRPEVLSLAGGLPAAGAFPVEELAAAAARILGPQTGRYGPGALQYGPTEGVGALREWVADGHRHHGGASPADVIVTTGSQQALDLLARALVDPGDCVVVESPTYLGALQALAGSAPTVVAIPGDRHGIRTDLLEERLTRDRAMRPKLCYVVTNFQNPTGATLALDRRRHLAALADHHGFVVVEDDPYGQIRFAGPMLPPIRAFTDRVVTLGTASKVLAPGLRVGWLTAPVWLVGPLVRLKQAADLHTSTLTQHLAFELLADSAFMARHLDRLRALYAARCAALADAMQAELGPQFAFEAPAGGMFLWGRVQGASGRPIDGRGLLARAIDAGVAFVPGDAFSVDGSFADHLRLSFASLSVEDLRVAAGRLARAVAVYDQKT